MTLRKAAGTTLAEELFAPEQAIALLRAAWPLAVGASLAERTRPLALQGRMLLVEIPDARWRRILHRLRREILVRLREVAGSRAPATLGFVVSRAAAEPHRGSEGHVGSREVSVAAGEGLFAPRESRTAPAALAAEAERIADPQLRERFLDAATRYLANAAARAERRSRSGG